jgi:2-iminobutanoate/2-iminopropanoate deaminase
MELIVCQFMQRAILENIRKVLQTAGSDLDLIVKANVFLIDMQRDFRPMNEVYISVSSISIMLSMIP